MLEKTEEKLLTLWILSLTFASGYANIVAIISFVYPVSHVTGLTSQLALAMATRDFTLLTFLAKGFILFFLGSTLSGILFHQRKFQLRRRYGGILFLGGIICFLLRSSGLLHYFLIFYMGLINGMFIYYNGVLVRTTHVTGYLTDAGFEFGSGLRRRGGHVWGIAFYLGSILFFFLGGYVATLLWDKASLFLGPLYLVLGVYYFLLRRRHT